VRTAEVDADDLAYLRHHGPRVLGEWRGSVNAFLFGHGMGSLFAGLGGIVGWIGWGWDATAMLFLLWVDAAVGVVADFVRATLAPSAVRTALRRYAEQEEAWSVMIRLRESGVLSRQDVATVRGADYARATAVPIPTGSHAIEVSPASQSLGFQLGFPLVLLVVFGSLLAWGLAAEGTTMVDLLAAENLVLWLAVGAAWRLGGSLLTAVRAHTDRVDAAVLPTAAVPLGTFLLFGGPAALFALASPFEVSLWGLL
jgi:hypothetical protein